MAVARLKRNDFSEVQPIDDDEEFVTGRRPDDSTIFVPEDEMGGGGIGTVLGSLPGTDIGSRETPRDRAEQPRTPHTPPPPRGLPPVSPPITPPHGLPPITPPTAPPTTPGPTATPPQPTAPTPVATQPPAPSPTGTAPLPVARRPSLFGGRSKGLLGSQEGLFGGGIGVPGIGESQPRSILDTLVQLFSQR